jgi:hypothetical protein
MLHFNFLLPQSKDYSIALDTILRVKICNFLNSEKGDTKNKGVAVSGSISITGAPRLITAKSKGTHGVKVVFLCQEDVAAS